jgi:hypothetical protein
MGQLEAKVLEPQLNGEAFMKLSLKKQNDNPMIS